jgi:hypothetical protein
MKTKEIKFRILDTTVDLKLRSVKTVIDGDSATGKTYLYNMMSLYSEENKDSKIVCINKDESLIRDTEILNLILDKITKMRDYVIVVDNADYIFSEHPELLKGVRRDTKNCYIIFGRGCAGMISDLADIIVENNKIEIKYFIEKTDEDW